MEIRLVVSPFVGNVFNYKFQILSCMQFKTYNTNQRGINDDHLDLNVTTVKLSSHRPRSVILGPDQYVNSVVRRPDGWQRH